MFLSSIGEYQLMVSGAAYAGPVLPYNHFFEVGGRVNFACRVLKGPDQAMTTA